MKEFRFMTSEQIIVLVAIIVLIIGLGAGRFKPMHVFLFAYSIVVIGGILDDNEALLGLANVSVISIALLLIWSNIIRYSAMLHTLFKKLLPDNLSYGGYIARITSYLGTLSGIMNNTPLVAMVIPYVVQWSRRRGIPPSRILIPLSYITIAGGTLTLLGTSSHLVINGYVTKLGYPDISITALLPVGIVVLTITGLYFWAVGWRLLPSRRDLSQESIEQSREYMAEARVRPDSPLVGQTVGKAHLRQLKGLFLVAIERDGELIVPVKRSEEIQANDILLFTGRPETIIDLIQSRPGLELPQQHKLRSLPRHEIVEAVVPINSTLVRQRVKDTNFRSKYDAAIIAVHRQGERLHKKIGDIVLQPGDMLLLMVGGDFWNRVNEDNNIYVVGKVGEVIQYRGWRDILIVGGSAIALLLAMLKLVPLFHALVTLLAGLLLFRIIKLQDLSSRLDWNLLLICAMAIPIGFAVKKVGLADKIVESYLALLGEAPLWLVLFAFYVLSNLITEIMFNVGAAAIIAPLAVSLATHLNVPIVPVVLTAMFAVALSVLTPYGYQVNLMVMGPGNYRLKDYVRVGLPLAITYSIIVPGLIWAIYFAK